MAYKKFSVAGFLDFVTGNRNELKIFNNMGFDLFFIYIIGIDALSEIMLLNLSTRTSSIEFFILIVHFLV